MFLRRVPGQGALREGLLPAETDMPAPAMTTIFFFRRKVLSKRSS